MTLAEICEPLFQYICKVNRLGRAGGGVGPRQVRDEVKSIIADMQGRAEREGIGAQFDRIEHPLIYFADHMVRESRLAATWGAQGGWRDLALDLRLPGGDERFWDLLEEALQDPSESATQRLTVFHTMIGLGFTGFYANQPDYLRKKMREIGARVRGAHDNDHSGRVTPDAYENVDTRTLTRPPARTLVGLAILLVGMIAMLLISYVLSFRGGTRELDDTLDNIIASPRK